MSPNGTPHLEHAHSITGYPREFPQGRRINQLDSTLASSLRRSYAETSRFCADLGIATPMVAEDNIRILTHSEFQILRSKHGIALSPTCEGCYFPTYNSLILLDPTERNEKRQHIQTISGQRLALTSLDSTIISSTHELVHGIAAKKYSTVQGNSYLTRDGFKHLDSSGGEYNLCLNEGFTDLITAYIHTQRMPDLRTRYHLANYKDLTVLCHLLTGRIAETLYGIDAYEADPTACYNAALKQITQWYSADGGDALFYQHLTQAIGASAVEQLRTLPAHPRRTQLYSLLGAARPPLDPEEFHEHLTGHSPDGTISSAQANLADRYGTAYATQTH